MNQCKDCVVDMICIKECPMFEIDLKRLQTDELIYTKRCMNNIKCETYKISKNMKVEICVYSIEWYRNGKCHRDNDQPAIIKDNGTRYWYKDGEWHRDNDNPAIIYSDGSRYWYKNGKYHRDNDQPAVIHTDGEQYWFKDGVEYEPM